MKRTSLLGILLCALPTALMAQIPFTKVQTKNMMRKVADWQIKEYDTHQLHEDLDWTNGALFVGMTDWAELSERVDQYDYYFQWLRKIGRRNAYEPGKRMYHADDLAVCQTWIDLYQKYKDPTMLWPVQARTDWVVSHPSVSTMQLAYNNPRSLDRWSWCDALFMAPPVYAKMYALTGDKKYIDFMNKEWKATSELLYDKGEHLFYRDVRYIGQKEANGKKIFWGRGAGWVAAGLANLLRILPRGDKNRKFYEDLFVENCTRLAELQCADGYWHASLLDPDSYPSPETSATGFITYALAYGVNQGLLDKGKFLPVIIKGWQGMLKAVESDGKLGYVQPIGADPKKVTRDMTETYGVGAFLQAGCQIYQMAK
ncbi:MAG: glycoside hydrolase family 88 protein [Prevotella sp.]|jgi:rhamnogalacturonyl hydrolase YesR|nr:glycoside hydrolase family 88 protein [Prevotella sp.]MCI2081409.1 glycoside hydrolase family 88 protein [Prevotella sp.]MCI2103134.1 glycoside hydrolase family 88 protein [Prevotella sp.]